MPDDELVLTVWSKTRFVESRPAAKSAADIVSSVLKQDGNLRTMASLSFDTTWPADTVEFVPGHDDLLVVGTYLLREKTEETPMSRVGELILLRVGDEQL